MTGSGAMLQACGALSASAAGASDGPDPLFGPAARTPAELLAESALFVIVDLGIVAIAASMALCLWRVLRGPTLIDRGLASDIFALQVVGLAVLLTVRLRTLMFFDAVLIVSILGFASTVAFAQFIGRRRAV